MKLQYKIGIASLAALLFIVIFGWVVFPKFLKSMIISASSLKKENDVFGMYLKVPFPIVYKVFMFNVTNPIEVTDKGAIPILEEIGPYFYDEWKEKVDTEEDEEQDTLTFTIKNTFMFRKELTLPLTGREMVTIPHPLLAGLALLVAKDKPSTLPLINRALNSIHRNPRTPFLTAPVEDILFGGVKVLCNVTDFPGKAVCAQLKKEAADLVEVEPMIFEFSLFGPKNGTKGQRLKIIRGTKNINDLGQVLEMDGQTELKMWSGQCNDIAGTDGGIFPPFKPKTDFLTAFAPDLCRTLYPYYVEDTEYAGLPVRKYGADFGDIARITSQRCFCPTLETCPKKGLYDLTPCVGSPLIASLPHFYMADPTLLDGVKGLRPIKHKHEIAILFEYMTGAQVSAHKRLQFNLPVHPIPKVSSMKNMPNVMLPMFWVEEGIDLNSTWTDQLNNKLFKVIKITKIVKYLVLIASLGGIGAAIYMHYSYVVQQPTVNMQKGSDHKQQTDDANTKSGNEVDGDDDVGHYNKAMSLYKNEYDKY